MYPILLQFCYGIEHFKYSSNFEIRSERRQLILQSIVGIAAFFHFRDFIFFFFKSISTSRVGTVFPPLGYNNNVIRTLHT